MFFFSFFDTQWLQQVLQKLSSFRIPMLQRKSVALFQFFIFAKEVKTFTSILRNYFNLDQMTMIRLCDTTVMNTDKHIFWVFSVCLPLIFSMWIVDDFGRDFHELNYPTIFFVWFVLMFSALVTQRHNKSKQKKMLYSDFLNKENVNI